MGVRKVTIRRWRMVAAAFAAILMVIVVEVLREPTLA
jgi:hypothetical protein